MNYYQLKPGVNTIKQQQSKTFINRNRRDWDIKKTSVPYESIFGLNQTTINYGEQNQSTKLVSNNVLYNKFPRKRDRPF